MLFSLARSGYAPRRMGVLNQHGVPMGALLASMLGIVGGHPSAICVPKNAYLYIINTALVGGMIAWLVSLLAHVRFRAKASPSNWRNWVCARRWGRSGRFLDLLPSWQRLSAPLGFSIQDRGQKRGNLSGGADRGVFAGEGSSRSPEPIPHSARSDTSRFITIYSPDFAVLYSAFGLPATK